MRMRDTCDLLISGAINRELVDGILDDIQTDYYQPDKLLRLVIDSPGGSIPLALTLARFLMNCFSEIHTYSLSMVDSAAVCLYLCGGRRYAYPSSRFFMHPPSVPVHGIQTELQLKEILQGLQTDTRCMIDFYCERTSISRSVWQKVFRSSRYMDVDEAARYEIVTDVCAMIPDFYPHVLRGCAHAKEGVEMALKEDSKQDAKL